MFASPEVERHVNRRLWKVAVDMGMQLGLTPESHVLDLGCGDGAFSNMELARHFAAIDGFDLSEAGIKRAQTLKAKPQMRFEACDITQMDFGGVSYDGAFLIGILHHVKSATPGILRNLRRATSRVVVLEPNGNHIVRKLMERTETYKVAGEDSFRTRQMEAIFAEAGYRKVIWKRLNLFPNFTPLPVFRLMRGFEPLVERTPLLQALCTVNMWGFVRDDSALMP